MTKSDFNKAVKHRLKLSYLLCTKVLTGQVAEWSKAVVLKTIVLKVPGVRIPPFLNMKKQSAISNEYRRF